MQSARPIEIEPFSNRYLIHPTAAALLPRAIKAGIHPNLVTGAGLVFGLLAGLAYLNWQDWRFACLGFVLMIAWHIMDGLDGKLARATGKSSDFGRFLDGVADYSTFVAVYLALVFTQQNPMMCLGFALVSGLSHALQSQFYEGERATYIRRINGNFQAVVRPSSGGFVERLYNKGEALLGNKTRKLDSILQIADEENRKKLLGHWQPRAARTLMWMSPLSANGRTLAIFIAVMADMPLLFWIWEIFPLTFMAIASSYSLRQAETYAIANS